MRIYEVVFYACGECDTMYANKRDALICCTFRMGNQPIEHD